MHAKRILRLERAAERIAGGRFDEPVVDTGNDELGDLADAFERMRGRLGKLDRARSEFIANASHELRTPLFSLGGFLELMADEDVDEATRQEFLETMREQVDRLAKLATDLLDLSRLDAGRMRVEHEPVDLGEVARVVAAEFGALAERRKHVVETDVAGQSGRPRRRVARAPGRAGAARQRAHAHARGDARDAAGLGRPRARLARGRGRRPGDRTGARGRTSSTASIAARATVASGSGLGLAIARELVEMMGGEVVLDSQPGPHGLYASCWARRRRRSRPSRPPSVST